MTKFPKFASRLEAVRSQIREHRFPEISNEGLSASERELLVAELHAKLTRVRLRAVRAHVIGASLTACFLALGLALLTIGPVQVLGALPWFEMRSTLRDQVGVWPILVVLAVFGAASTDYILRKRLRIAHMWEAAARDIRAAIQHLERPDAGS